MGLPMRKEIKTIQIIVLIVASVLYMGLKSVHPLKEASAKDEFVYVTRVVDGDTLKLSNGERVRLIGIDTPEIHFSNKLLKDSKKSHKDIKTILALGARSADFTRKLCKGKKVRLEFDVEKMDRYKRLLAYVYLEDGTFVNAKIVEEGYAQVMTVPPNVKYADMFVKLQGKARSLHKGLWGE